MPSPPTRKIRKRQTRLSVLQIQNNGTIDELISLKKHVKSLEEKVVLLAAKVDDNLGNEYLSNTDGDEFTPPKPKTSE